MRHYGQDGAEPNQIINLTGTIDSAAFIIVARRFANFETEYGFSADYQATSMYLNQNTNGIIIRQETNGIIDQMNNVPPPSAPFIDNLLYLRKVDGNDGSDIDNHWCQISQWKIGTPGAPNLVTFQPGANNEWGDDNNWDDTYQPCECNDVNIPGEVTQVIISESVDAKARNVDVKPGAELIVNGKLIIGN